MARIQANITSDWQQETVDTFKGGDRTTQVTGIATTFLATFDVLRKAKEMGLNMVITHEPTFYNHLDSTAGMEADPVLQAKQRFIADNGMVVFRFHDHIHSTTPDGIYQGVVQALGWEAFEISQRPYVYALPETNLKALAARLQDRFQAADIRVVGDPDMTLKRAGLVLGAAGSERQIQSLQREDVEVLLIGETREWETVEYVRDAAAMGKRKALILLGHAVSEEGGMAWCANWLQGFIADVPVAFIPAGDPFWRPE